MNVVRKIHFSRLSFFIGLGKRTPWIFISYFCIDYPLYLRIIYNKTYKLSCLCLCPTIISFNQCMHYHDTWFEQTASSCPYILVTQHGNVVDCHNGLQLQDRSVFVFMIGTDECLMMLTVCTMAQCITDRNVRCVQHHPFRL